MIVAGAEDDGEENVGPTRPRSGVKGRLPFPVVEEDEELFRLRLRLSWGLWVGFGGGPAAAAVDDEGPGL